jgi:hypothetical protein
MTMMIIIVLNIVGGLLMAGGLLEMVDLDMKGEVL